MFTTKNSRDFLEAFNWYLEQQITSRNTRFQNWHNRTASLMFMLGYTTAMQNLRMITDEECDYIRDVVTRCLNYPHSVWIINHKYGRRSPCK